MTEKILVLTPENCIGCRTCEMVCSLNHNNGCSRTRSLVTVITQNTQDLSLPIMCQHCETPLCQQVCPVDAISRDMTTHAMVIDQDKCLGCKMCVYACPFGAPSFDPMDRVIIKCDLCGGDPMCAKFCPTEAIQFIRNDKIGIIQKRDGAARMLNAISSMVVGSQDMNR